MSSAPHDSWFYVAGDQPVGPLSAEQFRAAISSGVVGPQTMVCQPTWANWCQAGEVPGLIPSAVPPVQVAKPPPVEAKPGAEAPAPTAQDGWFYVVEDRPVGPLSAEQLRAAISSGVVGPQTPVCHATWPNWCQAGQVPGLMPVSPAIPPVQTDRAAMPPVQTDRVATPPVRADRVATPPVQTDRAAAPPVQTDGVAAPPVRAAPAPASEPGGAPEIRVQVDQPDRPRTEPESKRRRKTPWAMVSLLVGTLAVGVAAAVALWTILSGETTPAKTTAAVDEVPDWVGTRKPRDQGEDDWAKPGVEKPEEESDFPTREWDPASESAFSRTLFEIPSPPTPQGRIDELVFAKWKELGIEPANQCSDAVFLRRAYLDVIGTLPTVEEARRFLSDKSPDKRSKLIDSLLERPEFADFWAMKWCDLLRVKAEFPINLWPNAAQAYHRWIRDAVKTNMPYNRFVRELLTSSGSNFRTPQVNFYRALQSKTPKGAAQAVALTFMGTRAEKWPPERLEGMSAFFQKIGYKRTGEWKEEIVVFDPRKGLPPDGAAHRRSKADAAPKPVFPDGTTIEIAPNKDPREVFADWLITPENPWFARQIVNRVWCWLLGRGIVHEPDDLRPDNPPSNPELLDWLAQEFVRSDYDLKHMYRLILNSSTYQLSPIPKSTNPEAGVHFASYTVRRLEAEVIIDALNQITGTTELYSSIIPEPYTFIPETRRAIALPDGSITSSFLELFGRPPRDSGMESERNNRITAGQRLHLLNSSHIRKKLHDGPAIKKLMEGENASENLYLAILSRYPGPSQWGSGETLAWALVNSTEFLFRH